MVNLQRLFKKHEQEQDYEPFVRTEKEQHVMATGTQAHMPRESANTVELEPLRSAPGTSIRYNPELIAHFEAHHAWLREVLGSIKVHAEKGEFGDAQRALQSFRRTLTTHLLEENIKIYTYVSKCLADDPDTKASMRAMKAEMDPVGTAMMRFCNEYAKAGITLFNKQQFLAALEENGAALIDRMAWEESSLYTMYMPPDAYK